MSNFCLVLITAPSKELCLSLAEGLVEERLVACVNVIPGVTSVYRWEGAIQKDAECLLICKTEVSQWEKLQVWVKEHHSYEVPEIIQIPIQEGSSSYLGWLSACLKK